MPVQTSNVVGTCGLRCEKSRVCKKKYDGLGSGGASRLSGALLRRLARKALSRCLFGLT